MWTQGARSQYRRAYWKFLWRILSSFWNNPAKLWMGSMILLAGHHFLIYAREVARDLACAVAVQGTESVDYELTPAE
jgi:hypothetical protein